MNNHHSLVCTTHNGAQHRVYNRRGILPSTAQGKSPSGRGDLSLVTHFKLYTTVVEYCPLYTWGPASSQGIERVERYKRAKRRGGWGIVTMI